MEGLKFEALVPRLASLLWFLVPSYLQGPEARAKLRPTKVTPTTYFDGLRGLCALFVVFYHQSYKNFEANTGWGAKGAHHDFLKLPIVRLLYQGSPAVAIFFVISGYVLSYRPLSLARAGNFEGSFKTLSSMTFRRFFRLYLPTIIATLITAFLARLGVFELTKNFNVSIHAVVTERHPPHFKTTLGQFKHWLKSTFELVEVYKWSENLGSPFDPHLWTIPVEFRCSLYLFLVLLGTSRLQPKFRFILVSIILLHADLTSHWELMLFLCGMMMAEYDILRGAHSPASELPSTRSPSPSQRTLTKALWILTSIISLYFLSYPDMQGPKTPSYHMLTSLTPGWWKQPRSRFWHTMGAVMFMGSLSHMPQYQGFFNMEFIFYLGKISYALYITHGPVIHSFGYMIEGRVLKTTGIAGNSYGIGWTIASCLILPIIFWAADVFWRAVDMPSVRFARWLEIELLTKTGEKNGAASLR